MKHFVLGLLALAALLAAPSAVITANISSQGITADGHGGGYGTGGG